MKPLISIVTVFYNRVSEVNSSIGSLLNQTYDNIEIIAVDDGSLDGTADELTKIQDRRLKVIRQENRGFTSTIDEAVRNASGEFIAIHGSGDFSHPSRIERQAAILEAHPNIAVVGCRVINDGGKAKPDRKPVSTEQPLTYLELVRINPITHGEAMFRKDAFVKVGGYRSFFRFAQDHDLWLRMDIAGYFWSINEPLYTRKRFDNAVNADPIKVMLQAYYGEFAEHCARSRREFNIDPVDQYGSGAGFFFKPTPKHTRKLIYLGLEALSLDKQDAGRLIIKEGLGNSRTAIAQAVVLLAKLSDRYPGLWKQLLNPMLKHFMRWRSNRRV